MVQTITTDFQFVTDGETTVENPGSIVGNENIIISNAEIQWQGTTETSSSTSYSTNTNYDSATATTSTQNSSNSNSGSATATSTTNTYWKTDVSDSSSTTSGTSPGIGLRPDGYYSFVEERDNDYITTRLTWKIFNNDTQSHTVDYDYDDINGSGTIVRDYTLSPGETKTIYSSTGGNITSYRGAGFRDTPFDFKGGISGKVEHKFSSTSINNDTVTRSYPSVPSGYNFYKHEKIIDGNTTTYYSNKVGQNESVTSTDPNNTRYLTLKTYGQKTVTNSRTASTSFPSVPSGHSFDRHYYREEKNGSFVDSDYIYTNKVGDTRSVTSNDPSNTWELTMQTRGEQTVTTTTETQDPSVSGDVSAAYNGTLGSQEYSSWQPLSGFELGDNSFVHDIGGTNEAFYQIRFDYELSFPTTVAEAYIHVGNTTYPVILADPSDPNLVYDFYRVNHPTHGELAFDVVNTTNADATPYTVTDGNGNVRALRENTQ